MNAKYYIDKIKSGFIIRIIDPKKQNTPAAFLTGFANKVIYSYSPAIGFCERSAMDFARLENHFENMLSSGFDLECINMDILVK